MDGGAVGGVTVTAAGCSKVISDSSGEFTLPVCTSSSPSVTVNFEIPGYYPEKVSYDSGSNKALDVVLTPRTVLRQELKVVESRMDVTLGAISAATSVVTAPMLDEMPRGIAIDEALQSVPGVKIDNQANGERVHLSIRGQGILSEHGIRGIQILYDGVPLNDPSGFSPDVYDIDWAGVDEVNVVRGPVAFLYGGGSAGGVIDVRTRGAEFGPTHGELWGEGGSNGFYKTRGELSGSGSGVAYLMSGSRTAGDGYRKHTAFSGNNFYGRFGFRPAKRLRLSPFVMGTGFENGNAEGLNLAWGYPAADWWTSANPDSITYNEFQRTNRVTAGMSGTWEVTERQRMTFLTYVRHTAYTESVPSSVEHRNLTAPGGSGQYEVALGTGAVKNRISAGADLDWQFTNDYRHPNLGLAKEGPELVANADITQRRTAGYLTDQLTVGPKWTLMASLRYDNIGNSLTDKLIAGGLNLSGSRDFSRATGRVGATFAFLKNVSAYASWGQGFLPPATEELYANPAALGGFNQALVPATSNGGEAGFRGAAGHQLFWETNVFRLDTENDFERYRVSSRPLETFYANAGKTRRYGSENSVRWLPTRRITLNGAYTYSRFTYTQYTSLTYPGPLKGKDLPNSPRQQLFFNAVLEPVQDLLISGNVMAYSRGFVDPTNKTWSAGYALFGGQITKVLRHGATQYRLFGTARNIGDRRYIAFTEPDPDGNSYQPGSGRELFGGLQVRF